MNATQQRRSALVFVALVCALLFAALALPGTAHAAVKNDYPSFDAAVKAFTSDSRWKPGISWDDSNGSYLSTTPGVDYFACAAYAVDFGMFVYGGDPFTDWEKYHDLSEVRAGDHLRITTPGGSDHSLIILARNGNTLTTLEGNVSGKVYRGDEHYWLENGSLTSGNGTARLQWGSHPHDIYAGYDVRNALVKFDAELDWLDDEDMADVDYYLQENRCPTTVTFGGKPLTEGVDYQFGGYKLTTGEIVRDDGSVYLGAYAMVRIIGLGQFAGTVTTHYQGITHYGWDPIIEYGELVADPNDHGVVTRLQGTSALDTMSTIIDAGKFAKGGTVVLASLEGYWDALTAAGIAGLEEAPVVMTTADALSLQAKAQIAKLAPKRIVVCGGTYWIPDAVVKQAAAAAGTKPATVRLAGDNAAITATKIFDEGKKAGAGWSKTAVIATAGTFQDALAAAPVAYANRIPIFLAGFDFAKEQGSLSAETLAALRAGGFEKVYLAGGTYWLPESIKTQLARIGITDVTRLSGATAVETSAAIAQEAIAIFGMVANNMGVATTASHYDALAGAAFCGKANSVMVLVNDEESSSITRFLWDNHESVSDAYIFGGESAVDEATYWAVYDVAW